MTLTTLSSTRIGVVIPLQRSVIAALTLGAACLQASPSTAPPEYNRDIRPIFSENCFACHGTDSASRKAGLRLDRADVATNKLEDGNWAIVPGQPDNSELVRRIFATDEDVMPPEKTQKVLTPQQKETLKRWIAGGAKYEPHWSLIAPQRAALPKVGNPRWARNPIDNFI